MARIVVLGAGLTGLSSAFHLDKDSSSDYKIFEKEDTHGGLCRSVKHEGFTFDYTGHLLHINDPYFKALLTEIADLDSLNQITRQSYIYSSNTYTRYPYQTNLYGLPVDVITECISEYVKRPQSTKKPTNFHQWVITHFGKGLGKHFFFPYNKKLWQTDLKKMDPSWTGRFVPKTSLESMLSGSLQPPPPQNIGYNSTFFYPHEGGIQYLPNKLAGAMRQPIHTNHTVTQIDLQTKTVYFENGVSERYEKLITTLPLNTMLGLLKESADTRFKTAEKQLLCTSLVNYNLGINREKVSDKHWIYFPEDKYSFYRIGFWSNFAKAMAPEGCSSLYGEFSYMPHTKTKAQLDRLHKTSIKQTLSLLGIDPSNVVAQKTLHLNHAYPTYDAWRKRNLASLLSRLEEHDIYSVGRFGAWKYSSMQEAILDGRDIAQTVLGHKPITLQGAILDVTKPSRTSRFKKIYPTKVPNLPEKQEQK